MYKILKAEQLTANIFLMDVEAPRVARHCGLQQDYPQELHEVVVIADRLQPATLAQLRRMPIRV